MASHLQNVLSQCMGPCEIRYFGVCESSVSTEVIVTYALDSGPSLA